MTKYIGSPGSGDYGMEMDDMQGHMEDMDGYGDESQGMVRYNFFHLAHHGASKSINCYLFKLLQTIVSRGW